VTLTYVNPDLRFGDILLASLGTLVDPDLDASQASQAKIAIGQLMMVETSCSSFP
jgi:hypothetical protein